ncbi:MAG: PstS family phosphate ABC transporter substrate-binding protein [Anaerolineae bacterium]|jgi:phosphate transport system substrate-binding protein
MNIRDHGYAGTMLVLILSLCLWGCTPPAQTASGSTGLEGTITVSGAFALYPMMIRWGEEFHELHPGVTFDISAGGAGKGMADALNEAVDIGMVSRPIFEAEIEKGAFWVAVAKDAVVATTNAQNPVLEQLLNRGLTRQVGAGIWVTREITTWGQVVGGQSRDEIHVYTRADACGAAKTWAQYLGDHAQEDLQGIAVQADPGVAEAVSQDVLAVGYNNLNFAYDADTGKPVGGIQVIPLDLDENGQIDPDERFCETKTALMQAIAEERYPSPPSRALNLVTREKPDRLVGTFLEWVMTDGQQYLEEVGYVHLSQQQLDEGLGKLQ